MIAPRIVIIDSDSEQAAQVARELEFLDETNLCLASPDNWRRLCGDEPVLALFVGPGIAGQQLPALFDELAAWNRDLPLVLFERVEDAACA